VALSRCVRHPVEPLEHCLAGGRSRHSSARSAAIDARSGSRFSPPMCNLYSITRTQEAMRRLFRVKRDLAGNLPGLPAVYPDTMAPVVRTARDGECELTMMPCRSQTCAI
jgi:hypothetical protein